MSLVEKKVSEAEEMNEFDEVGRYSTLLPCFVRDILVSLTNEYHPMTQQEMIRVLDRYPYSIVVERRTLSRTLEDLILVYSYICRNASGYYYKKPGDVL